MNLDRSLLDHPKFQTLKRRVQSYAVYALIRLWAHCEQNQRGETWLKEAMDGRTPAEYVEYVARWGGKPGALWAALVESKFVSEYKESIDIHDWEAWNSHRVANWSRRVGKTKAKPVDNTQKASMDNPGMNHGSEKITMDNPRTIQVHSFIHPSVLGTQGSVRSSSIGRGEKKIVDTSGVFGVKKGAVASKAQWTAVNARLKELETQDQTAGLLPDERREQQHLQRKKRAIEKAQRDGNFEIIK